MFRKENRKLCHLYNLYCTIVCLSEYSQIKGVLSSIPPDLVILITLLPDELRSDKERYNDVMEDVDVTLTELAAK